MFLSSLLSGVGLKLIVGVVLVAAVGGAFAYHNSVVKDRAKLQAAVAVEQQNHLTTTESFKNYRAESEATLKATQEAMRDLALRYAAAEEGKHALEKLLSKHDLGALAKRKPGLIERRANDATKRLWDDFETATGAGDSKPQPGKTNLPTTRPGEPTLRIVESVFFSPGAQKQVLRMVRTASCYFWAVTPGVRTSRPKYARVAVIREATAGACRTVSA